MDYGIGHAPKEATFVATDNLGGKPKILSLKNDLEKEKFVTGLTNEDRIFLPMGGVSDRLSIGCYRRGANVLRIPIFRLPGELQTLNETNEDEDIVGTEFNKKESNRRTLALALYSLGKGNPEAFYQMIPADENYLVLGEFVKAWRLMQKARVAAHLRLLSVYRDIHFLTGEKTSKEEFLIKELTGDKAFAEIPIEEREAYIKALLAGDPIYDSVGKREKSLAKKIEEQIKELDVWSKIFEPIKGCGPLISARIIGSVKDILRFPGPAELKAYAGYHHFEDGSRARRIKGQPTKWNQTLRQGVYLFTQQLNKQRGKTYTDWTKLFDCRRGYELFKLLHGQNCLPESFQNRIIEKTSDVSPEDLAMLQAYVDNLRLSPETKEKLKGIKARSLEKAERYLGQKFLEHIYQKWVAIEERQ